MATNEKTAFQNSSRQHAASSSQKMAYRPNAPYWLYLRALAKKICCPILVGKSFVVVLVAVCLSDEELATFKQCLECKQMLLGVNTHTMLSQLLVRIAVSKSPRVLVESEDNRVVCVGVDEVRRASDWQIPGIYI